MKRIIILSILIGCIIAGCGQTKTKQEREQAMADSINKAKSVKAVADSTEKANLIRRVTPAFPGTYSLWVTSDLREDLTFNVDHSGLRSYYSNTNPTTEKHAFTWGIDMCGLNHPFWCDVITTELPERSSDGVMMSGGAQRYYAIISKDTIVTVRLVCELSNNSNGCYVKIK